jgi:hypothetical protein
MQKHDKQRQVMDRWNGSFCAFGAVVITLLGNHGKMIGFGNENKECSHELFSVNKGGFL